MNLTLSTVDGIDGTRRDHLVDLPGGCTVAELGAALDRPADDGGPGRFLAGAGPARKVYLDGAEVPLTAAVHGSGIRSGAVLGLGRPIRRGDRVRVASPDAGPVLAEVHVVSGPASGRSFLLTAGSWEVGTAGHCAIRVDGPDAPAGGLWVTVSTRGTTTWHQDPGGEGDVRPAVVERPYAFDPDTGLTLEGAERPPVPDAQDDDEHGRRWEPGTDLAVGPVLLRLAEPVVADAAVTDAADGIGLDYNRPPRIAPHLDAERVRLPNPPTRPPRQPFPALMLVAPIVLGLVLVGVFKSYFYLVFILFTPVMAITNWMVGRRGNRKQHEEQWRRYRLRMDSLQREVHDAVRQERHVRCVTGPDPATLGLVATGPGVRLWERRRRDPDHLLVRLGTADLPSVKEIDDPGRDENHRSVRWNIRDVPVGLELAEYGVVGVAGPTAPVQALARWFVAQSAVLHSPRDLRVVVLTEPQRSDGWGWVRWLPHLRPAGGGGGPMVSVGNDPESVANRVAELVAQLQARQRALGSSLGKAMFTDPDVLVILDGARQLRDVPGVVQLLTDGPRVRLFSICLDEQERLLPEECTAVVVAAAATVTLRRTGNADLTGIRADLVAVDWCEWLARALAPLRDVSPEHDAGLPREVRLLDLLDLEPPDPAELLRRWERRPASTTFMLGRGYDGPLALDLVRDGPHGLVAGTTGSGKSELLQAFVASLAAANRPDELTFVLVDYKGGSAFRECAELPHTLGMVTDLDAHLVRRAMESLGAELRRRERILADAQSKDLPAYRAKRAVDPSLPRLPRLLLVIDEFATLVREVPDFVPGLIGIAQRGRSLGIHLILATQRPAGAVTPDIKANTNLRIALRVTDTVESQDIIDTGEAVTISPGNPGRALVRAGHRTTVPFQAAWVGAGRHPDDGAPAAAAPLRSAELSWQRLGRPVDLPSPDIDPHAPAAIVPTDLQVFVAAVVAAAGGLADLAAQPSPWLPALQDRVLLPELTVQREGPVHESVPPLIPYALEDVPQLQQRRVATVDLGTFGHLYVIGAPRSGRTQVLRTIAGAAAQRTKVRDVHLYGIDAAGGGLTALEALPHCGGVVSRHDMERLERLLRRLGRELTDRQERCAALSCAGLVELRRRVPAAQRPPHILLFVDGWDALAPVLDEHDQGRLLGDITRIVREGAAAGIHVIATSERALLGGRLAAHNDHKLLLRQADRNDYQLVGILPSKVPATIAAGRGWHVLSRTETQVALLDPDDSGQAQAAALRRIGTAASPASADGGPFTVAGLPSSVAFTDAYEQVPAALRRPMWGLLGVGGDDGTAVGVDLATTSAFYVGGPPGTGRSNVLATLAVSLLAGGTGLVVFTPRESPLRALARHAQVRLFTDPDPGNDAVQEALAELRGPAVVLVDDADLLTTPAADKVLRAVATSGRDHGQSVVYAGAADALSIGLGAWLTAARRARRGLLLAPRSVTEGDAIGARLTSSQVRGAAPVGRAYTSGPAGTALAVQVPLTVLRD
ncbi:FtsK/SpoIIIE domain-containing protein [Dactylosporangium sp. NBC_01737]|uniref:FtsK/SpoIIIE domain-containing protein n=1 Tax=Dactylosporangium sp. NBC_01737 TaxID=2975959 RepID=UPI002E0E8A0A|nr:FtsK/SpoIIIE domain-containing protein [Dactylosporangium sp. NBC_01737]